MEYTFIYDEDIIQDCGTVTIYAIDEHRTTALSTLEKNQSNHGAMLK